MIKFLNLQPEVFGMDITDSSLTIVKLVKNRGRFKVVSYSQYPIKKDIVSGGVIQNQEELIKIIRSACHSANAKKLKTKYVVLSLPEEKSFVQLVKMPAMEKSELKSAVPFEMANYIPLAIDKVYLDSEVINSHSHNIAEHLDLLVNAMPKNVVDSYVSCVKMAGLIPWAMELRSHAVVRALLKEGEKPMPTIFLEFNEGKVNFVVFAGDFVRFTFSSDISLDELKEAVKTAGPESAPPQNLEAQPQAQPQPQSALILVSLVEQLKKYVNFYHSHVSSEHFSAGDKIEKIVLCGSEKELKGLPEFLSQQLQIPTQVGNPLVNVVSDKIAHYGSVPPQWSSYAAAIGLAIRGAAESVHVRTYHD